MSGILQTALADALLVTAAAPVVWAVSRLARRPALTHALWLIVLIKLLTPPLWTLTVQLPRLAVPAQAAVTAAPVADVLAPDTGSDWPVSGERVRQEAPARQLSAQAVPVAKPLPIPVPRAAAPVRILFLLEVTWAVGAALCLLLATTRVIRFSRLLRHARPAPELVQARADLLGCQLRLGKTPRVQFIPGTLCPMLWSVGWSARLLVPQALWDRLDPVQRDTVLLHELAHWARRDHWVRWIELIATSLYWWLPACWWARRELRKAEEQCCDACVMWALPGTFHNYANALLEAVEFVSVRADRPSASIAVPVLASGMGQFHDLKGRLTMLKHGNVSRALSWGGMAAAFGLGALLLPISPTIGQDEPSPTPASVAPPDATPGAETSARNLDASIYKKLERMTVVPPEQCTDAEFIRRAYLDLVGIPPSPDEIETFLKGSISSPEKRRQLLDKLTERRDSHGEDYARELRDSRQRIDALTRQLQDERARIAAFEAQHDVRASDRNPASGDAFLGKGADLPLNSDAPGAAAPTLVPLPGDANGIPTAGPQPELRPGLPPPTGQATRDPQGGSAEPGKGRVIVLRDPSNRVMKIYTEGDGKYATAGYQLMPAPGTPRTPQSERLDKLEAELRMILQEIETIRAQSAAPGTPAAPGPAPSPAAPEAAQPPVPTTPPAMPPPSAPGTSPDALPRPR